MRPADLPQNRLRYLATQKPVGELTDDETKELVNCVALFRYERSPTGKLARLVAKTLDTLQKTGQAPLF